MSKLKSIARPLFGLVTILLFSTSNPALAQCSAIKHRNQYVWFEGAVTQGLEAVPAYVEGDSVPSKFISALNDAIDRWKDENPDGSTTGKCAASTNIPNFDVVEASRPGAPPPGFSDIRNAALSVVFLRDQEPPLKASGLFRNSSG